MKLVYLWLLSALALYNPLQAQYALSFHLHQLPGLAVDAGRDSTVTKGQTIRLNASATGGSGNYQYQWMPATGLDNPSIAQPLATINTNITYIVYINDGSGCIKSDTVQLKLETITAILELESVWGFRIFPNPSQGTFLVTTRQPLTDIPVHIQVFNRFGQEVYRHIISRRGSLYERIDLPGLAKGLYILNITGRRLSLSHKIQIF